MMTQKETNVWKQIQLDMSPLGWRLFRNQRYKGQTSKGAWVDCGVGGDGGSDLVGYRMITITPDMVGTIIAQYAEVEAKYGKGRASPEQKSRLDRLNKDGAIGILAYCTEDVIRATK